MGRDIASVHRIDCVPWRISRNNVAVRNVDFWFWRGFGEAHARSGLEPSRNNVSSQKDRSYMATVFIKLL
jgi:hypothetical protein